MAIEKKLEAEWKFSPRVLANVVQFEAPPLSETPWLESKNISSPSSKELGNIATPQKTAKRPHPLQNDPEQNDPLQNMPEAVGNPPWKWFPSKECPTMLIGRSAEDKKQATHYGKRLNMRGGIKLTKGEKLTKGSEHRTRQGPQMKRDTIVAYNEQKERQPGVKHPRLGGKPLIEAVALEARVPLSCLRAWIKNQDKLFRHAGQLHASMIMGVKQRKMGRNVKNVLRSVDESQKPLLGYLHNDH